MTAENFTRILVVHHAFAESIVEQLRPARPDIDFRARLPEDTSAEDVAWTEALVGFRRPAAGLGNARWVHCIGAGVDGWTSGIAWPANVLLTRTTQSFAVPIGEYVLARVLAAAQEIPQLVKDQQDHRWRSFVPAVIHGSRAVIVGTGDLGMGIAERLAALGVTVDGVSRSGQSAAFFHRVEKSDRLAELVYGARWLVLAAPLTDETRNMINAQVLSQARNCWLINVARAPLVDDAAMLDALDDGRLAGAALDVFMSEPLPDDSPLWLHQKVLISPHVAGVTSIEGAVQGFLAALSALEEGREPPRAVEPASGY
jgi:phosphoglycerate dehydrogenase-like enzyme